MHPLLSTLLRPGPILTDGAWGTQLQAHGLNAGEFPDLWNLTHPEKVLCVARSYVKAGSRVILTNTFGANRVRFESHASASADLQAINRAGVQISKDAAGSAAKVFASIGPSGKMLLTNEVTPEQLRRSFAEQAESLAAAGADALVIETMSDLAEAEIAVVAAKPTGLPVVCCMAYDSGKNRDRTMMGVTPEEAATRLAAAGADVIGANCGQGIAGFYDICRRLKSAASLPVWIKANAGMPEIIDGHVSYRTTAQEFGRFAPDLVRAGAAFIGGCCGTDPGFIVELRRVLWTAE